MGVAVRGRSPEDIAGSLAAIDATLHRFAVAIRAAREQADKIRVAALVGEADMWLDRRLELNPAPEDTR